MSDDNHVIQNDNTVLQVDDQFLQAMGMGNLPDEAKEKAIGDILYVLNSRIGERLADQFTEAQLDEVNSLALADKDDDQEALMSWLQKNVPNYGQILEEEAQKLCDETSSAVDDVVTRKRVHTTQTTEDLQTN